MDLFNQIVATSRLHPNYSSTLLPQRKAQRELFVSWAEGFIDRDGKLTEEFQTTFNSSFWEIYLHALFKAYSFRVDWSYNTPDFILSGDTGEFVVEATTANAANGKLNEWDKTFHPEEVNKIRLKELNKEAIVRLSNSIYSKWTKYISSYSKLSHVRKKPFVIAVAPFEQPYFNLQYDRPIRALLYDYYIDEDEYMKNPSAFPRGPIGKRLHSIEKDNGAEICLGLFNDSIMKEVSAVLFSCTATWGKVAAMTDYDNGAKSNISLWATAPHGHPVIGDPIRPEHQEKIFDGLQVYHNPYASVPLPPSTFRKKRVVQHYIDRGTGEWCYEGRCDALLYRQIFSARLKCD